MIGVGWWGCALLGTHQPPPGGLAAALDFELGAGRREAGDDVALERGAVAFDDRQQLGFAAELAEDDLERLGRLAPGDELLVDEADRVAAAEAALGVVAGGLGDAAGAHALEGLLHR